VLVGGGGCWRVLATMGCLGIKFRNGDDGAATEEKMCRGGVGVLYRYTEYGASSVPESGRRSVRMGNGSEMWARGRRAQGGSAKAWEGWLGGGRRWAWTERRGEGKPWGSVLLAPCYSLRAASCLLFGAWAWFTGLLWLCQDSRSVPIASRPASIQLRGPSKSRDGSGSGGKGPR
jgi:hypothetical protein